MKTKLLLSIITLITFVLSSCSSTINLNEIRESSKTTEETTFIPKYITKEVEPNLMVIIEPIKADSINSEILKSLNFDGSYSEVNHVYYNFIKQEDDKLSSSDRKLKESIIKLFDQIDKLRHDNELGFDQAILFKEKIYNFYIKKDFQYSYGQIEPDFSHTNKSTHGGINPYFSNYKYNSVYKLSFKNNKKEVQDLKIDNFQVFSNGELLYPFKNSYFENKFKNEEDQEKLKTVYRMNMPDNVRVVSKQTITKYFSTPALNNENQNLEVNYINGDKVVDFNFQVTVKQNVIKVLLESHYVKYKSSTSNQDFNVINVANTDYLLKKDKFFLEKNNENLKLLTLNVDFYKAKIKLTTTNFTTNNLTKNTIIVDNKK